MDGFLCIPILGNLQMSKTQEVHQTYLEVSEISWRHKKTTTV